MKEFNQAYLKLFKDSLGQFTKWKGINALNWAKHIDKSVVNEMLNRKVTREDLMSYDFVNGLDDRELSIAILSWGGMNRRHGLSLFSEKEWIKSVGLIRRSNNLSREDAYEQFYILKSENKLPGLGPAYYTKLVCFLNTNMKGYIMDQWTAKSVNLLCNKEIVKLTLSGYVNLQHNNKNIYKVFCEIIDKISADLNKNGLDVEESMFSNGGKNKGMWRKFVIDNY